MAVTFTFYQDFAEKIGSEVHDLGNDAFKWALSNTLPVATHTQRSEITEIASGNGYTQGTSGAVTQTYSETGGTATFGASANVVFTASGGSIAQFRYAILYNDTATNDELIGYIDHGSAVDLADTQTYTINSGDYFTIAIP